MPDPYLLAVSKLASKIANLLKVLRGERVRRNKTAAKYFADLAKAMEQVLAGLKKREIPRVSGHEMETLLRAFEQKTSRVLGRQQAKELQDTLREVSIVARTLDSHYLFHQPSVETEREAKLQVVERMIGDLKGLTGCLSEEAGG